MTKMRVFALVAVVGLAAGCWTYPADILEDAQTQVTPDLTEDASRLPDVPFVDEVATDVTAQDISMPDSTPGGFHPAGWLSPAAHGKAAMLNTLNCTMCHGVQLDGGTTGYGCDSCHSEGWRTNCTFCHGGVDNQTGAPPAGLAGETEAAQGVFPAHGAHVTGDGHAEITCSACHKVPTSATTPGHMFDETPGKAEVDLSGGLSAKGKYGSMTCSSLYCHGNGQGDTGSVPLNKSGVGCSSCHPGPSSSEVAMKGMSGKHARHVEEGVGCYECHGEVFDQTYSPVNGSLHVNGTPNVKMPAGITFTGSGCTGICHGEYHMSPGW